MIKYPSGKIYEKKPGNHSNLKIKSAANRGMNLEEDINLSNSFYNEKKVALITKRPTPITVNKVDYARQARITDAFFAKQSTTDYNGIYKGKYLDFEAKSTKNTSLPFNNISQHQFVHLKNVILQGGLAFFIICFDKYQKTYLIKAEHILAFYEDKTRKSIPYVYIQEKGVIIEEKFAPRLDYLAAVDKLFF